MSHGCCLERVAKRDEPTEHSRILLSFFARTTVADDASVAVDLNVANPSFEKM